MKLKFWLTVIPASIAFIFILAGSLLWKPSENSDWLKGDVSMYAPVEESYFRRANYYITEPNKAQITLFSTDLSLAQDGSKLIFLNPEGQILRPEQLPLAYKAKSGIYRNEKQSLILEGNVIMNNDQSTIRADSVSFDQAKDAIRAEGDVWTEAVSLQSLDRIQVEADSVHYKLKERLGDYTGHVRGTVIRRRPYEESLKFKSSRLFMDLPKEKLELNEDVWMSKLLMTASAQKGEIFLENYNKKLKYFALYDDVKVDETVKTGGRTFTRKAFGQKLEGMMSDGRLILTGFPRVLQLRDVIQGNRIVLRENNEVIEVDDASSNFELK